MKRRYYTDTEIDWLRANYPRLSVEQLAAEFNATFGANKTPSQIKSSCKNRGITCGRGTGDLMRGRSKLFTAAQVQWLIDHYPSLRLPELVEAFNAEHGADFKKSQVFAFLKNHKITCGRTGHFGERPGWNKGTAGTGLCKPNRGSFKKGNVPGNLKGLYSERVNVYGYVEIKVPLPNPYKSGQKTRYMAKNRWVWEQHHGPIPRNHVVIFDDGDRSNFEPDNLRLVSRAELQKLNELGYFTAPPELRDVIRTTATLAATVSNPRRDLRISRRDLVLDSIAKRAKTSGQIAVETSIEPKAVAQLLFILHRRNLVTKTGLGTAPSGRHAFLWRAAA